MVAKKTMEKKELLQANAIFLFWDRIQTYTKKNIRQIAAIGLIICMLVAGIGFWKVKQTRAEKESLVLFSNAISTMAKNSENPTDREEKYNQALKGFRNASNQYPNTKAGIAALFYAGNCSYNIKKYDDAISYYKKFLDTSGSVLYFLRPFAYEGIGYVYEEQGEYKKALEWFKKQKSEEPAGVNSMALLNLARCYEFVEDREAACQSYREFIEKHPLSSFKEIAQVKIANLCNKKTSETNM